MSAPSCSDVVNGVCRRKASTEIEDSVGQASPFRLCLRCQRRPIQWCQTGTGLGPKEERFLFDVTAVERLPPPVCFHSLNWHAPHDVKSLSPRRFLSQRYEAYYRGVATLA
jgi:hypothetical protein